VVSGIIVAAGRGTRMGATLNKVFLKLDRMTVLEHTVAAFLHCDDINEIVVVTGHDDMDRCRALFADAPKKIIIVEGGQTRQESVYHGILASNGDMVAIHDGARALILPSLISQTIAECKMHGAAVLGVPAKDTIKLIDEDGFIQKTLDRDRTYQIQTPQTFSKELILSAHQKGNNLTVTDDAALMEELNIPVKMVFGSYENIKLTTPEDMSVAKAILKAREVIDG